MKRRLLASLLALVAAIVLSTPAFAGDVLKDCPSGLFNITTAGKLQACAEAQAMVVDAQSRTTIATASADAIRVGNQVAVQQTAAGDQATVANQSAYPPVVLVGGGGYNSGAYYDGGMLAYGGYGCPSGYLVTAGGCTAVAQAYGDAAATQAALGGIRLLWGEVRGLWTVNEAHGEVLYGPAPPSSP